MAIGLYLLLNRTRIGTAMRASVDNPELLQLYGGRPDRVAALSWAIGISLSALAGILLASVVGLDYYQLTLLVINAYAAAMVGRLRSLPLTFAGAMGLGMLDSLARRLHLRRTAPLADIRPVIPALFLFAVLILLPQAQLRVGQVKGIVVRARADGAADARPPAPCSCSWHAGAVIGMSETSLLRAGTAATFAIIMLSLVLLTGYGGHVSLAQLTFAGVGALAYAKLDEPNLYGLLVASLIAAGVGALVALPGAAADRPLPRPGDAGVRRADGQDGLPGRVRVRLRRRAERRAALDLRPARSSRPTATCSRCWSSSCSWASPCWCCAAVRSAGC